MTVRSFRRAHARRVAREGRRLATARRRALVAGATLGASAVFATSAQAAGNTYTVTTSGDDNPAVACNPDNTCNTLRDAIYTANADGGNDTIQFASGLSNQTITLGTAGELDITAGGITIQNPDAPGLAVSGNNASRVFLNGAPSGTTTTISGLTVEDGNESSSLGGAIYTPEQSGGGATLVLSSDVVKDSTAVGGGGVDAHGPLSISASQITGNSAFVGGGVGAKYGPSSIVNSTISGNTAKYGAGVESGYTDLTITGSQITGNTIPTSDTNGDGRGGGIESYIGSLTITNTTIANNATGRFGGGVADYSYAGTSLSNVTVSGNTATSGAGILLEGDRSAGLRTARARIAAAAKRDGISLPRNAASAPRNAAPTGPGPITISDSTISGNSGTNGAGISVPYDAANEPITISASTLSGNTGGTSSFGGGLLLAQYSTLASPFELIDSTISGNSATNGGGVSIGTGYSPVLATGGSIAFDNSTIDSNTASASGGGGGIYLSDYMSGSPSAENSATSTIFSTIAAGNTAAGAGNDLAQASGSTSGGFNVSYSLIQQPGNAPLLSQQSVIKGVDPQLGPLTNNGGPTQTMLQTYTSPVIDQGKASAGLTTDQRGPGFPRTVNNGKPEPPGGDGTDIGAVELAKIPIVAIVEPATTITGWAATLNGKITTNGQAVTWYFQYGTSTNYGKQTSSGSISAGNGQVPVSFKITGLHPHTRYHYRVVGVGANGVTSYSADATFETLSPTINASPSQVQAGKKVRVHGFAGGCTAGDRVTLISSAFSAQHMYFGRAAIYATVKSGGYYSVKTKIPKGRDAGRYAITARCAGNSFATTAYLRVTKPAAKVKPVTVIRFTG